MLGADLAKSLESFTENFGILQGWLGDGERFFALFTLATCQVLGILTPVLDDSLAGLVELDFLDFRCDGDGSAGKIGFHDGEFGIFHSCLVEEL